MAALARTLAPNPDPTDEDLVALAAELQVRHRAEMVPGLSDDEIDDRIDHSGTIANLMLSTQAQSLAGLKAKAFAAVWATGDEATFKTIETPSTYDQIAHSIISDLLSRPTATVHPFPAPVVESEATKVSALQRAAAEFAACRADAAEASKRASIATDAAEALHPDMPDLIRDPQRPGWCLNLHTLQHMDETAGRWTRPKPEGSPRVEAFHRWSAQKAAINSSFGVQGLDEAWERAKDAEDAAANRVAASRPETIKEAVLKYAVLLASFYQDEEEIMAPRLFADFLGDLEHVARLSR